jgi:hypothetical protein
MKKKSVEPQANVVAPKNEAELIRDLQTIKRDEDNGTLAVRWGMGNMILNVYQKKYGEDKLQVLAKATGFSKNTLQKCIQFVRGFSPEELKALTTGPFTLSWRYVASNMTVSAAALVKVYQESKDLCEFRNAVTKLKPPKKADENGSQKTKPKSRRELENEIARLKEILQVKDQQIEELNAEIDELKEQIEQTSEIGIEDDNINMTDPVAA